MKASHLLFLMCGCASPLPAGDGTDLRQIFSEAVRTEAQSFEAFGEAKAVSAAMNLKISLENARRRVNVPPRKPREIDASALADQAVTEAALAARRDAIRTLHKEMDDMIAVTRQLLEQLQKEETGENIEPALEQEELLEQIAAHMQAAALAAEDSGERARDLTGSMNLPPRSPAAEARTDAEVAAQAARSAAASARTAKQKADDADQRRAESDYAEEKAQKLGANAKTAAEASSAASEAARQSWAAAFAAGQAAVAGLRELEQAAAQESASASTEAVCQAIIAAIAAGELSPQLAGFGGFEEGGSLQGKAMQAQGLAGQTPEGIGNKRSVLETVSGSGIKALGTSKRPLIAIPDSGTTAPSEIGPTLPSRRIAATGEPGTGWIRIDTWYIIGPFPNPSRQNIDVSFPPESLINLDAVYFGEGSEPLRWEFVQAESEMVRPINDAPYVIYYAYSEFWSDADRDLWVALGSDDNSRVWLNDHLIWKSGYGLKNWRPNEGFRRVRFQRGLNRILYRVENGHGGSGFSFLIQIPVSEQTSAVP
ncbi:MAG: hypothetical protein SNJ52_02455 [Verrucomicrobiia bacterium]